MAVRTRLRARGARRGAAAATRARRCSRCSARAGAALALGLQPSAATSTLAGRGSDTLPGDRALPRALRRPRDRRARARAARAARADRQPRPAARAGGLPLGQRAAGPDAARRRRAARARRSRASRPVQVVYGPGTFINSAVGEIQDQLRAPARRQGGATRARRPRAARELARRAGQAEGRAGPRWPSRREQLVYAQFVRDLLQLNLKYGLGVDKAPRLDDPDFVVDARVRPGARRDDAEGALRLPVPVVAARRRSRCGSSRGCRTRQRERAIALVRRGGARCREWKLQERRRLHGHRRAGAGRGPRRRARRLASRGCSSSRSS